MEMATETGGEMIARNGLSSFSARGVAKAIGYSVATIHNVFGGYDMLVLCINARTLDAMYRSIRISTQDVAEGEASIRAMAQAYYHFALSAQNRWRAIFEHSLPAETAIPDWYAEKTALLFAGVERHMQLLSPHKDAQQSATALWAGVHGICILSLSGKLNMAHNSSTLSTIDNLLDNFIAGYQ